ncbi:hypothetical protein KI387_014498, partial [Taxus chinensis]
GKEYKEREEDEKEPEETAAENVQDMETQVPNLEAKVPNQQRSRRTSGEHIPPTMGYVEDMGKIVCARFQGMIEDKDLFSEELMDEDM